MEEAGIGAHTLHYLKSLHLNPSYMERSIDIVYAENLYEASLPGDEPEPLARMTWPLDQLEALIGRDDVSDSVSIAALYMVREYINSQIG